MRLCWAEKDAMIWTDNILMEHIKAWKWSRRSACLWSPHSLALNSQGGAQCSHSETGWMTDAPSLVLSLPLLCLSNVNEFKQPAPTHPALCFSLPLFLSPQNISSLGKFLVICSHRLNEFQLGVHWPWCPPPQREVQRSCIYLQGCSMLFNCSISFFHWQVLREQVWEKAKPTRRWYALMRKELHLWNFIRLLENTSFYWRLTCGQVKWNHGCDVTAAVDGDWLVWWGATGERGVQNASEST